MDEEEAVKNVTWKTGKKSKSKSGKDEKNEEGSMGIQEVQSISAVEVSEHVQVSGKEDTVETKRDKKELKKKKNEGSKVAEPDIKKGTEGESTVACGEDGSGDAMVNVEKKRKKREKNKNMDVRFEKENEKILVGENSSAMKSTEDASKERKKHKSKRKREYGDFEEGEKVEKEIIQHSWGCEVNAREIAERKKRKKEKKESKDYNWCQGTSVETNNDGVDLHSLQHKNVAYSVEGNIESAKHVGNVTKEVGRKKKKKNKKKGYNNDNSSVAQQDNNVDNGSNGLMNTDELQSSEVEYASKKKKKKKKIILMENGSDDLRDHGIEFEKKGKMKDMKLVENGSDAPPPNKSSKKVRFSGQVEVFSIPGNSNKVKDNEEEDNMIRGKRFTPEEDEIVKKAVFDYIQRHDLGEEGLNMVLNSKKHPQVRGCWKELSTAIPYRPYSAIYYRAQNLFSRSETRRWTQEEYDEIRKYQEEHGNEWKVLAEEFGRHRVHVKDTWRRIKLSGRKKGHWSQEEYQKLFNLVNVDLQAKLSEEKRSKHGMLRDNICWTVISDELSTRSQTTCCIKWYNQLSSSMVAEGIWADTDDYRLINALYSLDATCMEDVDWDCLVDGRCGDVCRKRWNQMVLHIGRHGNKSFAEQVEVLAQRYCANLLAAREIWDSKPRVP
ncbi:hypothetical protein OROMI_007869 [Orobanche minor]